MYQDIFKKINEGSVVLTANRRLTLYLQEQYAAQQSAAGLSVWPTSNIMPLDEWVLKCWQELTARALLPSKVLLNPYQESIVWNKVIAQSQLGQHMLQTAATATHAQRTWKLCQQWSLDIRNHDFSQSEDTQAFQSWARDYATMCEKNDWIDSASLINELRKVNNDESITKLPKDFYLIGFVDYSPAFQRLQKTLGKLGCVFHTITPEAQSIDTKLIPLQDEDSEILSMARWAKQRHSENTNQKIACIVPNLSEIRQKIATTFRKVLSPDGLLNISEQSSPVFNISAGLALSTKPIIHAALSCLKLGLYKFPIDTISYLLRSPFFGMASEIGPRALLDAELREYFHDDLSLKQLISFMKRHASAEAACPKLLTCLEKLLEQSQSSKKKLLNEWADKINEYLNISGWPGQQTLNNEEEKYFKRWNELITDFFQLASVESSCDFKQAYRILDDMAASTIFQTKSGEAPIQILGILEATGLLFDHMWVMGMHDQAWPHPIQPNPFIPHALQKKLDMPHTSAEREWKFCDALTGILNKASPNIVFSHPLRLGDGEMRKSPLIRIDHTESLESLNLPPYKSLEDSLLESQALEDIIDKYGPKLPKGESVSGGTELLKQQAACPFRSFAQFRMKAKPLRRAVPGLAAFERGFILHNALELFWKNVKTHEKLCSFSEEELAATIQKYIALAVKRFQQNTPKELGKKFLELEVKRLERTLSDWLNSEKSRDPFVVVATEEKSSITISEITLNIRADRIDQLSNGDKIIIDYKTGIPSLAQWFGDRPDEPQLPLYCTSSSEPMNGILFAQIRASGSQFKGLIATESNIPGVIPIEKFTNDITWSDQLSHWKKILNNLAKQFESGYAEVSPKDYLTCGTCNLQGLCRVD